MSSASLLEQHLRFTHEKLQSDKESKGKKSNSQVSERKGGRKGKTDEGGKNFVVKARKELKVKQQRVKQQEQLILAGGGDKKKSRKAIAKLIRLQAK
jgi:RNase P/RNase MRP subunit p30